MALCWAVLLPDSALAGPPFVTDDPEPVDYHHYEINIFTQGTRVRGDTSGLLPAVDANYGLLPNVQIHVTAPMVFDKSGAAGIRFGYGDTELGVKYRFLEEREGAWWPQIAVYPLLEVPSDDIRHRLGAGQVRAFLPVWLQKDFGSWSSFGGGGYWQNPGNNNKNYWFLGWALQRKVADDLWLGGELFYQSPVTIGGEANLGFNMGATYDINNAVHLLASAGRGIVDAPATNEFSYYLGIQLTF